MHGNDEWIAWVLGQNYSGKIESYNRWKKTLEDLEARKIINQNRGQVKIPDYRR